MTQPTIRIFFFLMFGLLIKPLMAQNSGAIPEAVWQELLEQVDHLDFGTALSTLGNYTDLTPKQDSIKRTWEAEHKYMVETEAGFADVSKGNWKSQKSKATALLMAGRSSFHYYLMAKVYAGALSSHKDNPELAMLYSDSSLIFTPGYRDVRLLRISLYSYLKDQYRKDETMEKAACISSIEQEYDQIIRYSPKDYGTVKEAVSFLKTEKKWRGVISICAKVLENIGDDRPGLRTEILFEKARAHFEIRQARLCEKDLEVLLLNDPQNQMYRKLQVLNHLEKRTEEGYELATGVITALREDDNSGQLKAWISQTTDSLGRNANNQERRGRFETAYHMHSKLVCFDTSESRWVKKAELAEKTERYLIGIDIFQHLIDTEPSPNPEFLLDQARLYAADKEFAKSTEKLETYKAKHSEDYHYFINLIVVLSHKNSLDSAIQVAKLHKKECKKMPEYWLALSSIYASQGKTKKAQKMGKKAAAKGAGIWSYYLAEGNRYMENARFARNSRTEPNLKARYFYDKAKLSYRLSSNREFKKSDSYPFIAEVALELNEFVLAKKYLKKAIKKSGASINPRTHYLAGRTYMNLGDYERAITSLQAAKEQDFLLDASSDDSLQFFGLMDLLIVNQYLSDKISVEKKNPDYKVPREFYKMRTDVVDSHRESLYTQVGDILRYFALLDGPSDRKEIMKVPNKNEVIRNKADNVYTKKIWSSLPIVSTIKSQSPVFRKFMNQLVD